MPDAAHRELTQDAQNLALERLRQHALNTPSSVTASLMAGAVLPVVLWNHTSRPGLIAWYGCLLLVMAVRGFGRAGHLRAEASALPGPWLRRYQAAYLLHGLVWLGLLPLLAGVHGHEGLDAAAFVITAMVGGSFVTSAFDLRAATLFAVPAAVPLYARLLGLGGPAEQGLALVAAVFMFMMLMSGRRAARMMARQLQADSQARERYAEAQMHAQDAEAARRELATVHERTEQLFEGTRLGYWFVDPQGRTLDVNPSMCQLLGRTREQLLALGVFDCFNGAERQVLVDELALRRQGKTGGYEIDIVRPDGTRLHTFNQATPIYDAQGLHIGSVGLWTDLTAQKQLELELRTYERVTNSITDVVSVVDARHRYQLVNDAWCTMMGASRAEALDGAMFPVSRSLATPERSAALEACLARGVVTTVTSPSVLADGRQALLQTTFYPYRDGGSLSDRVILVTRDISDQARDRLAVEAGAEYLRRTLNATGDAIFASDADDPHEPVRFANDQMMRIWGLDAQTPASLTPADILEAAARQFAEPELEMGRIREIIAGNQRHECRVRLRDGRVLYRRYEPAFVAGRRLRVWSFRDVTAEEQLLTLMHEREAQARALLDAFPGFISRFDAQLRYTYVNAAQAQMAGSTAKDLLGRRLHEVIGAQAAEQVQALMPQVMAGQSVDLERSDHGPKGAVTVRVTLASGRDPLSGEPVLYAFGTDVSGLKQAELALRASEREMRALLQAFPGHISAVDEQSRYAYADERLSVLFGRPLDQVLGRTMAEVLGEERARALQLEHERVRQGETVCVERTYRVGPQQERRDLEVTHVAGPRGLDGHQMIYSFSQDITARNRAREALAAARDEAERANKAKSQFLSHMSHELRTPMNAIVGFAQLLRRDSRPPLVAHQQGYAQQILRGAEHLLGLINEVLDLGRIEAGRLLLELAPVPVAEVVGDALAFVRELARSHGVRLDPVVAGPASDVEPAALVVLADRTRLRQVLLNLLANAIKYNRPDGHVQVRCWRDGGHIVIEVQDSGRGIDPADQQRLFQPFERLGAERGAVEGTGIGLALSRRLVHAMAGDLGVRSEPGLGSTFWVSLPAVVSPVVVCARPDSGTDTPAIDPAAETTVLYIDDNEVNLMLMEALLADAGSVRLVTAQRPAEGLKLAQRLLPSLVLLDIHMPEMDGYEVLARLRSHAATAGIPVVAVSADAMPTDVDAARAAGFAAYLTKPLDFDQLLLTIGRLSPSGQNPATSAP